MSDHDPNHTIGPEFIPVAVMLHGINVNDELLPEQPMAEAINALCERGVANLERAERAGYTDSTEEVLEPHLAKAILTAIGVLTLIGGADTMLCPHGDTPARRIGPDPEDAITYADDLCGLARKRWPAPPRSWYEKPGDDDEDGEGSDGEPEDEDSLEAIYDDLEAELIRAVRRSEVMLAEARAAEQRADALVRRMEAIQAQ